MKSFSHCLKKHGLDKFEREFLTSRVDALLEGKEASDKRIAAGMAVNAYEGELLDQRDAIYKAIGLEAPARTDADRTIERSMAKSEQEAYAAEGKKNNAYWKRRFQRQGISIGERSDITGERGKGLRKTGAMPGTFRKGGLGIDDWGLRLVESGYLLPESQSEVGNENVRASVEDTRDFIARVLAGEPVYPVGQRMSFDTAVEKASDAMDGELTPAELMELAETGDPDITPVKAAAAFDAGQYLADRGISEADAEAIIEEASRNEDDDAYRKAVIDAAESASRADEGDLQGAAKEAPGLELAGQTNAEIVAADEKAKAEAEAKAEADRKAEAEARAESERKEIKQRSEAAADSYELGQSGEDNLSGQGPLFNLAETVRAKPGADVRRIGKLLGHTLYGDPAQSAIAETPYDARRRIYWRTGKQSIEVIEQFVDTLKGYWKNAPPIKVVQTAADLPFKAPDTTRGAFSDGTVYLVANNLHGREAMQFVLLHETMGHYGLRGVLGDRLRTLMTTIYNSNASVRAAANARMEQYKKAGYEIDIAIGAEEALADMAGNGTLTKVTGWQMLYAAIRNALRHLGFTLEFTDAEITALLKRSRDYVRGEVAKQAAKVPESMFSLLDDGIVGAAKQAVLDHFAYDGKSMSWINKSVNTQFHKAETNRFFRRVYQGVQRYIADVNAFANDAADLAGEDVLPRLRNFSDVVFNPFKYSNWKKENQLRVDMKAAGKMVWAGTLAEVRPTDRDLAEGLVGALRNSLGDRIGSVRAEPLTPRQIEIYRGIRKSLDHSLNQTTASEMVRVATDKVIDQLFDRLDENGGLAAARKAAKARPENAATLLTEALQRRLGLIEDARARDAISEKDAERYKNSTELALSAIEEKEALSQKLQNEGYAPLMRFGEYTAKVSRIVNGKEDVLWFGMFESKKAANQMAREMLAEFQGEFPDAVITPGTMNPEAWKQLRGLSLDSLEAFANITGLNKDEAVQDYIKMAVSSRNALKRLIHRKGIGGFDEDIQRVLATFVTSQARLAARNYHMGEINDAIAAIPHHMGDVHGEADKLAAYVQSPGEEAQGIRGFLFIQFLGGSIASAITNITQPILMTLPYLSQYSTATGVKGIVTAPADATLALTKALKVVASGTSDEALSQALKLAAERGITEPQEIHQLYAESIRSGIGGRSLTTRKLLRLWGSAFSLSEAFNRRVTFVAAFEMARQAGGMAAINEKRAAAGKDKFDSPFDFAANAVEETQGVYNKGNRPNWARNPVGATVFTFKQFSIAYIEFLSRLPKREQAIALAILVFAAGAEGLPFADDLIDLWDTIWQALGFKSNAKKSIRKWATQTLGEAGGGFLTGGVSNLPGSPVDVSSRLGVGNMIPGTALFLRSTKDATREVAQVLGPIGSVAISARQGVGALEEGQPKSAAYNVVPKAIRDVMQSADMWQTGYYRDLKGRRTVDVDKVDAGFKFFGLQPSVVAEEAKKRQDIQQDIDLHDVVEASIADRWARGVVENDPEEVQRAIADLFSWNARNPELPIAITPQQIRGRVMNSLLPASVRQMKATPREIRGLEFPR